MANHRGPAGCESGRQAGAEDSPQFLRCELWKFPEATLRGDPARSVWRGYWSEQLVNRERTGPISRMVTAQFRQKVAGRSLRGWGTSAAHRGTDELFGRRH